MNRIAGIFGALVLMFLLIVPVAAAAEPWDEDEHFLFNTGGDITLPAGQHVDMLVVVNGTATIAGDARAVFVINGTANFVDARTSEIVAISSHVSIDGTSVVTGHIQTISSTVDASTGSVVAGGIRDLGPELVGGSILIGSALFLAYLAFVLSAIVAGLVLAGVGARQARAVGALIGQQPLHSIGAAFAGLIGIVLVAVLAIVTVFGAPFGLGLLLFVLPAMFFAGYLVAGIWLGDQVVGRMSPGVDRDHPYLAALVGLAIVGAISVVPGIGGVVAFVGFGALILHMWRVARPVSYASQPGTVPVPSAA